MNRKARWLLVSTGLLSVALAGVRAQDAAHPGNKAMTPASLQAEIEALQPARLAWREIGWKSCLLAGLREARAQHKPVLLWAFGNGDPAEKRC